MKKMFISEKYKEGIIYQGNGNVLVKVRCKSSASDESIYNSLKAMAPLIEAKDKQYRVNTVFKNILDQAPISEDDPKPPSVDTEDMKLVVPVNQYIIENMIFTDEEIYGEQYDGVNRKYRVVWKDQAGTEHFVPLEGIDTFQAVNPNGAYSYNSETKQLIFSAFMPYEVEYIIRRYTYNE